MARRTRRSSKATEGTEKQDLCGEAVVTLLRVLRGFYPSPCPPCPPAFLLTSYPFLKSYRSQELPGALLEQDHANGGEQDQQVQKQVAVFHVVKVVRQFLARILDRGAIGI